MDNRLNSQQGFTLIELVMSIIILGIVIIPTASVFAHVAQKIVLIRQLSIMTLLAEQKMDEVLGIDYATIANENSTAFASPYGDYNYTVTVYNVQPPNMDTSVSPTDTGYKKVTVSVTNNSVGPVILTGLVTDVN